MSKPYPKPYPKSEETIIAREGDSGLDIIGGEESGIRARQDLGKRTTKRYPAPR